MQEEGSRGRRRRASFNSMYDAGDESTQRDKRRATSRSSLSRLDIQGPSTPNAQPSTRATTRGTQRTHSQDRQTDPTARHPRRGRLTAQEFANNLQRYQKRHRSASSQSNVQIWRRSGSRGNHGIQGRYPLPDPIGSVSQPAEDSLEETHSSLPRTDIPPEVVHRLSNTQILRDADTFDHYRLQSILRKMLRRWGDVAWRVHIDHRNMEAMAVRIDSEALLRQAFEHWRFTYQGKRQAAETDRFFANLERRAGKARDLYLLTKAFTHWAQCASEEVVRTSVARRHILRTKYFNAWRDITAVNELKVRRQGLRKFFMAWKRRYGTSLADSTRAVIVYQEKLVESLYWRWFWSFCERRAPQWRAGRIKRKYLAVLVTAVRKCTDREYWIDGHYSEKLQRNTLREWLDRTRITLSCHREAAVFRQRRLIGKLLPEWQERLRLAPIARHISNVVDWRIARSAFSRLVVRFRAVGQAAQVDRLRVLRNGWTNWNDHLRWQTLAHRLDDRVALQALYRWVLAERSVLLRRLLAQRSQTRVLSRVLQGWATRKTRLDEAENAVQESRDGRLLRTVCGHWRQQLACHRQKEQLAFEFRSPKIAQDTFQVLVVRSEHMRQLQRWTKDAEFYLLAKKSIKRWQNATTESKRRKRRDAYVQVRRRTKMNLARRIILPWRERTHVATEMQRQAQDLYQSRLLNVGTNMFDHWRHRLDHFLNMYYHAQSLQQTTMLQSHLQLWTRLHQHRGAEQEQARTYYVEVHVSSVASTLLRKLSLRAFEIQRQQETAESLKERTEKKHFRNIFRHWQDIALERTSQRRQEPLQSARARRSTRLDDNYAGGVGPLLRRGDVIFASQDFDSGNSLPALEARQNTTPMPGYLSTPSKRAARAKDKLRISMTPKTPGTPKNVSFEHRLRSEAGTDPLPFARRNPPARSGSLWKSHFEDIQEASPSPYGDTRYD